MAQTVLVIASHYRLQKINYITELHGIKNMLLREDVNKIYTNYDTIFGKHMVTIAGIQFFDVRVAHNSLGLT